MAHEQGQAGGPGGVALGPTNCLPPGRASKYRAWARGPGAWSEAVLTIHSVTEKEISQNDIFTPVFFYSLPFPILKIALLWDTSQSLRNMRQLTFQVLPTSEVWGRWNPPRALIHLCKETGNTQTKPAPLLSHRHLCIHGTQPGWHLLGCRGWCSFFMVIKRSHYQTKDLESGCRTGCGGRRRGGEVHSCSWNLLLPGSRMLSLSLPPSFSLFPSLYEKGLTQPLLPPSPYHTPLILLSGHCTLRSLPLVVSRLTFIWLLLYL